MTDDFWGWMRRKLLLDSDRRWIISNVRALHERISYLEAWVRNMDQELSRLAQDIGDPTITPADTSPKQLADRIAATIMAAKRPFPTNKEDLQ